jgi:DNA-binding transcriptional regulator YbjK
MLYPRQMARRRDEVLDAAIAVLGEQGSRAFTHRSVDRAAGVPLGTTANYFATREALVDGVIERFAALERAAWEQITAQIRPTTAAELAHALTLFVRDAIGSQRNLVLARYALFLEATREPRLRDQLVATAAQVRQWGSAWLAAIGSSDPAADTRILLDQLDGIILHQLAMPDASYDPGPDLLRLLTRLGAPRRR